jgi:PAS domain S-box-containing protein
VNLPVLKYFAKLSEPELLQFLKPPTLQLLDYLAANNAEDQIADALGKWMSNQLPQIGKEQLITEDITLLNHVRKRAFLNSLVHYTTDAFTLIEIIKELDQFIAAAETASFKTFIGMISGRLNEQVDFIEKINSTSPGIIYVYDLQQNKVVYSNWKVKDLLGYSKEEIIGLGEPFEPTIQHPDDVEVLRENIRAFSTALDGEIRTTRHRMKHKNGEYRWVQNHESVFKRNEEGKPVQIIGIALDIDKEEKTSEQLQQREEQLLRAQELAGTGSFIWNLETLEGTTTPQLLKILELDESRELNNFSDNIHPQDKERVRKLTEEAIQEKTIYDYECRYMAPSGEKTLWARGDVSLVKGVLTVKGTIMDVTERHKMMQRLQQSDELFKEAQALTHIGNWTWELASNTVTWSEELYRIYGLEPNSENITLEKFLAFIHPDDREYRVELLTKSLETIQPTEYFFRIIDRYNNIKILHGKSEVRADRNGKAVRMIGTCQDVTEKQLLIERLQESEKLYKQAQALSHIGNWSYDLKEQTIEWSDEMFRIYGKEVEQRMFTYGELFALNHPDDAKMIVEELAESITNRTSHSLFYRIVLKDGSVKVIHSIGEPLVDENGEPYKLVGTAQDVTVQKLIEAELQDNRNFIHKIADATPSIITSYNIQTGKYRFVSEGLKKLLGYEPDELLVGGLEFMVALVHPDDLLLVMEKNAQALEKANDPNREDEQTIIAEFQYRVRNKEGRYRHLQTYGTVFDRNSEGNVEHVLNISIDVTDHLEVEKRLAEQEHFIQHIAEASPTMLYLFDLEERRFLYINKEVKEVLGYEPEEIIEMREKAAIMYLHPEDAIKSPDKYVKYTNAAGTGVMRQFEGRVKNRHKKWKWILTREMVFKRDEQGKALQVLGSALDITERKEMEQALVYKTLQLQQSNSSLEEFAHVASHDLQEPLRKITTFGDRLLSTHKQVLSADGQLYLDKIVLSTKRMQQLISDILSVSLISGVKTFEEYSLNKILEDVLQTLEFKIDEKQAVISAEPLPEANVIPSQFRQLFQNLLSNSIKFSRNGIAPDIQITHEFLPPSAVAKYKLQNAGQYLQIKIKDNGIGFEEVFSEKIFSIFQRLNSRAEYEGTGIGLAICKKIVENHGGIIMTRAVPDDGAEFTIIIPA